MKIRTDFVTNSSSSSFICLKCGEEIDCYDWDVDYEREMCGYCYSTLSDTDKEKVDRGEYTSDSETNILNFINYLCEKLCLDEYRVKEIYESWRR